LEGWLGPAVVAAIVAASVSWLREVWFERRRRRERVLDLQIALVAEIRAYQLVLERDDLAFFGEEMDRRIRGRGDGEGRFVPFVPKERNDTVFSPRPAAHHPLPPQEP